MQLAVASQATLHHPQIGGEARGAGERTGVLAEGFPQKVQHISQLDQCGAEVRHLLGKLLDEAHCVVNLGSNPEYVFPGHSPREFHLVRIQIGFDQHLDCRKAADTNPKHHQGRRPDDEGADQSEAAGATGNQLFCALFHRRLLPGTGG